MSAAPRERTVARFPGLDEAKLLAILDAIPARIAFIGRDLRHLYVNSEQAQSQGVKAEEIVGKTVPEMLGEEFYEKLRESATERLPARQSNRRGGCTPRGLATAMRGASISPVSSLMGQ